MAKDSHFNDSNEVNGNHSHPIPQILRLISDNIELLLDKSNVMGPFGFILCCIEKIQRFQDDQIENCRIENDAPTHGNSLDIGGSKVSTINKLEITATTQSDTPVTHVTDSSPNQKSEESNVKLLDENNLDQSVNVNDSLEACLTGEMNVENTLHHGQFPMKYLLDPIYIFCTYMSDEQWEVVLDHLDVFDQDSYVSRMYLPSDIIMELQNSSFQSNRKLWRNVIRRYIENRKLEPNISNHQVNVTNEGEFIHVNKFVAMLYNHIRRLRVQYTSELKRIESLIQFSDEYLQEGSWFNGILNYAECCELLRDYSGDKDMVKSMSGLIRVSFFGYAHALFWCGKYIEASYALKYGFHYFHTFASMPFSPQNTLPSHNGSFEVKLNNVFNTWMSLKADESKRTQRIMYQFLVGYYLNFDERKLEAIDILEEIYHDIPEALYIINNIKEMINVMNLSDEGKRMTLSSLLDLSRKMTNPETGVKVRNRKQIFRSYDNCFVGHDLVTWVCKHTYTRRNEALDICRELYNRYFIRHVSGDTEFKDQYSFYRFQLELVDFCFTPIIREAELQSKAFGNKMQKFWAILYASGLILFDSKKNGIIKEIIDFQDPDSVISASAMESTVFSIQRDDFVIGFFKGMSPTEAESWIDAINNELREYRSPEEG